MARPRLPEREKLVPVTAYIPPARYDEIEEYARVHGYDLSKFLRRLILREFRYSKTTSVTLSP